jgi:YggT family protein
LAQLAGFIGFILGSIIQLIIVAVIVNAVLSWLVAFEVINRRNQFVYNLTNMLDAVTRPLLAPFRRFIPPLGGVDITPILLILVLEGIQRFLLPLALSPFYHTGL